MGQQAKGDSESRILNLHFPSGFATTTASHPSVIIFDARRMTLLHCDVNLAGQVFLSPDPEEVEIETAGYVLPRMHLDPPKWKATANN